MSLPLLPKTGRRVMGIPGQKPEFSNFSWFSMMFGAGLGVGLMVFATAEHARDDATLAAVRDALDPEHLIGCSTEATVGGGTEAEGEAAVRRDAVAERLEQETEA